MAGTDIAALLEKQRALSEGKAEHEKLVKASAYHAKQATRKQAEAATLAAKNATLEAELAAVTGKDATPPTPTEKPAKK
jgi:hypothetical protein